MSRDKNLYRLLKRTRTSSNCRLDGYLNNNRCIYDRGSLKKIQTELMISNISSCLAKEAAITDKIYKGIQLMYSLVSDRERRKDLP